MTAYFKRERVAAWQMKAPNDATSRAICGLASTFEPPERADSHGEIVNKHAFDGSVALHKAGALHLPMLWQHGEPIGVWTKIEARPDGLYVEGEVLDTTTGNDALKLIRGGAVKGLSIGYSVPQGGWKVLDAVHEASGEQVLELLKIDLREVSPVTWGSNKYATIQETRSALGISKVRKHIKEQKQNTNNEDLEALAACAAALTLILKLESI